MRVSLEDQPLDPDVGCDQRSRTSIYIAAALLRGRERSHGCGVSSDHGTGSPRYLIQSFPKEALDVGNDDYRSVR